MLQNISSVGQQFLANLETLDQNMATTQEQLSSGFVINKPSDDPAALGDVLQLESELGNANQVSANLGIVSGAVNTAESRLETATQLMSQAQSLASQGASSSASASARTSLSQQAEQILTQLVSISQTQYGSSYVFSGIRTRSLLTNWINQPHGRRPIDHDDLDTPDPGCDRRHVWRHADRATDFR